MIYLISPKRQIEIIGSSTEAFDVGEVFKAFGNFIAIFLGSIAIGATVGCLNAAFTKFTKIKEFPNLETAMFLLISYSTYLAAEAASFSGKSLIFHFKNHDFII